MPRTLSRELACCACYLSATGPHIPLGPELNRYIINNDCSNNRYQLPDSMEHERLHCLSNPSTFLIKEMVIGVNTADILMDLSKQETSRGQSGDRMGRLANHILQQRSYYPMCPPAPGLNLVYEHMDKLSLPISPDIMVLPSDLRFFAKNVRTPSAACPCAHPCIKHAPHRHERRVLTTCIIAFTFIRHDHHSIITTTSSSATALWPAPLAIRQRPGP